jgi:hypothetical protein
MYDFLTPRERFEQTDTDETSCIQYLMQQTAN